MPCCDEGVISREVVVRANRLYLPANCRVGQKL